MGSEPSLLNLLERAKGMDLSAREQIIESYTPYILKIVSNFKGRYATKEDEEFSIALLAFNEAIDKYEIGKTSFLSFVKMVITRRLIDYSRKQSKLNDGEVYFSYLDVYDREDESNYPLLDISFDESFEKKLEIYEFKSLLKEFGISFDDLIKEGPKHNDTRFNVIGIGRYIAENNDLSAYLLEKKMIPVGDLEKRLMISRKILNKYKKYITAVALILIKDYFYLKEYIPLKGVKQYEGNSSGNKG